MNDKWTQRFKLIRAFGWMALPDLLLVPIAILAWGKVRLWIGIFALILLLPALIYIVIIWHWKDRYRGKHGDLWGALILIETSGWMKIVYLFRHLIPDMTRSGRYRKESDLIPSTTKPELPTSNL